METMQIMCESAGLGASGMGGGRFWQLAAELGLGPPRRHEERSRSNLLYVTQ